MSPPPRPSPRAGVAEIAEYAENPTAFCERRGRPFSEPAARAGRRAHRAVGHRQRIRWWWWLVPLLLAALALAFGRA